MKTKILSIAVLFFIILVSCETEGDNIVLEQSLNKEIPTKGPIYMDLENASWSFSDSDSGQEMLKSKAGKSENREVVLYSVEYFTGENSEEVGNIIFFNNLGNPRKNQNMRSDFVADSPYLVIPDDVNPCGIYTDKTNDISYYVDEGRPSEDLGVGLSTAAIDASMTTWDNVNCSDLGVFKRDYDSSILTGAAAGTAHPICDWAADVVHAGWMGPGFFDYYSGDGKGGSYILGATFTYIVVIDGIPSDDDNNGKYDVWFREIYYNDNFKWSDDGSAIDIETVALHESGHGLSQVHFGKGFRNKGGVHFAPRAVMNNSYSGIQTSIRGTDKVSHCANWEEWPSN